MTNSFAALKKGRSNFADLAKKLEDAAGNQKDFTDSRFWTLTTDKAGNGSAVIRFLPTGPNDDLPFVKTFNHGFKSKSGKWFIENCPTTVNGTCPVCEANSELWDTGEDANKKIASARKRKLSYTYNIYVVSDPANKENEGKVFLYRSGKKIFDKIMAKAKPEFADDTPVNVFDLWEGANFKLRVKQVAGFANYDDSVWMDPKPLLDDDAELEKVWKSEHSLKTFIAEKNEKGEVNFKSYDDLKKQFDKIVGSTANTYSNTVEDEDAAPAPAASKTANAKSAPVEEKPPFDTTDSSSDEEDVLARFQRLASED